MQTAPVQYPEVTVLASPRRHRHAAIADETGLRPMRVCRLGSGPTLNSDDDRRECK
jgi:hypothetical protein